MPSDRLRLFALVPSLAAALIPLAVLLWLAPTVRAGTDESLERYDIQCQADGNGSEPALDIAIGAANENLGRDEIVVVPVDPSPTVPCIFTPVAPEDDYGNGNVGLPLITDDLVIRGEGIDVVIQRDPAATDNFRLLESTADLTLENVTVRNGRTSPSYHGGGILAHQSLTLTNVVLTGNVSYGGGGAYVGGSLTMSRTVVGNNEILLGDPAYGGGVWAAADLAATAITVTGNVGDNAYGAGLYAGGAAQIDGGVFVGNNGRRGAGLYAAGDLLLTNSAFYSNTASSYGGGLLATAALSVADTTIAYNEATYGGGLYLEEPAGPDVAVTGAVFEHNVASNSGAGLYVLRHANVDDARFSGNQAAEAGGGAFITSGNVENSLFEGNSAGGANFDYAGGGLLALYHATVHSSRFLGNTAPSGAGVFLVHAQPGSVSVLVNNLWVDNEANEGGAIFAGFAADEQGGGHAEVNHNTIVRQTQNGGGAVHVVEGTANVVNNVLVRHNVGVSAGPDATVTSDYNLFFENLVRHAGVSPGANNLDGAPLFVDAAAGDYHLQGGSPAIDSGTADYGTDFDLDGVERPQGDGYDRGAYEYVFPNTPPTAAADTYSTTMDLPLAVSAPGVLGNDSDADGDALTAVLATTPSHGDLTLNPDGSFTYSPDAAFSGTDAFTYRAADGEDTSAPTTVTLVVEPVYTVHLPAALKP